MFQFVLFVSPNTSDAEIYKYTDAEGMLHFVDAKEKVPEEFREQLSSQKALRAISKVTPGRKKLYEKERYEHTSSAGAGRVELFVTDWCSYCRKLEAYLDTEKIAYKKYDIEKDKKAAKLHASLGSGVPITRIGTQVFSGYRPEAIVKAARQVN